MYSRPGSNGNDGPCDIVGQRQLDAIVKTNDTCDSSASRLLAYNLLAQSLKLF